MIHNIFFIFILFSTTIFADYHLISGTIKEEGKKYYKEVSFAKKNNKEIHLLFPPQYDDIFSNTNCDKVVDDKAWLSCYSQPDKISIVISYTLYGNDLRKGSIKKRPRFYGDNRIKRKYRAEYKDYTRSGYDRGHSRSHASTAWDKDLLYHTYSMVNIWPQEPTVNRYTWLKAEKYERLIARKLGKVSILNIADTRGSNRKIGPHGITVPVGFYKVLYNRSADFKRCFYYKNVKVTPKGDKLRNHEVDCNNIYY